MKHIEIFTDGSCAGNPGRGGWGAILRYGQFKKELFGSEKYTTNNRMELTAVIEALYALKEPCDVTVTSDSKYVTDGINQGWVKKWKEHAWRRSNNKPAENADLWDKLLGLMDVHTVHFVWIKGHDGHPENERCDALAVGACMNQNI